MSDCPTCHGKLQYCTNPEDPGSLRIYAQCGPCVDAMWEAECERLNPPAARVFDPVPGAPTPMGAVRCWPTDATRRAFNAALEENDQ